jgi:type IV secretory pathway VirB10-like protein
MSSRINHNHYRKYGSNWRKSQLGKTKPNNRYLMSEIKKTHDDFVRRWGAFIKERDPAHYYSLINRPLPKKYQKPNYPIAPVNAYVPEQSKLPPEELRRKLDEEMALRKQKEAEEQKRKETIRKEQERIKRNQEATARERKYIFWCNPNEPINKNRLGSSRIIRNKKNVFYY